MADEQAPPPNQPTGVETRTGREQREQREETQRNAAAEEEGNRDQHRNRRGNKDKASRFTGTVEGMHGNVFQLYEESRKANQFTKTMEALYKYAAVNCDYHRDLKPLFGRTMADAVVPQPSDDPPTNDAGNQVPAASRLYITWKKECELYSERIVALPFSKSHLWQVAWAQSSESVKSKVEATPDYETAREEDNLFWLLTAIKNSTHRFEPTEYRFDALMDAVHAVMTCTQGPNQGTTAYYETMKELIGVLHSYGGQVHQGPAADPGDDDDPIPNGANAQNAFMRDRCHASLLIRNADRQRFGTLVDDLKNNFARGNNQYPTTMDGAHQMLLTYRPPTNQPRKSRDNRGRGGGRGRGDQTEGGRGGRGGQSGSDGGRGGRGNQTTGDNSGRGGRGTPQPGRAFTQHGFSLSQFEHRIKNHFPAGIPDTYILLDSDSTVSIFRNPEFLTEIHDAKHPLILESNGGGHQETRQQGTLAGFGKVWYNPASVANILSLAEVRRVRRVTMDSAVDPAFVVHREDGTSTVFAEHESGLYLHDVLAAPSNPTSPSVTAYSYLHTVADNKSKFTKRQVEAADEARKLYRLLGRPSMDRFLLALNKGQLNNCPLTAEDAKRAEFIYGKDVAFLKGKTTAKPAKEHVPNLPVVALPPEILDLHPNVTLTTDLFYVLGLVFSLSVSRDIHYISCRYIKDRTAGSIKQCLTRDLDLYRKRGFRPSNIHADGEYNPLIRVFDGVKFDICAADDHVPEAERAVRTIKETLRATVHGMPYKRLPRTMVKALVENAALSANQLPHTDGVSDTLSPETIVTGAPKLDYKCLKLEFGTYAQVYDGTSNDTKSRTLGAIALNPTGNANGDYHFMSLITGQLIHRRSWTAVPISDNAISRVEAIALEEGMPLVDEKTTLTEYAPNIAVDEAEYDKDYTPQDKEESPSDLDLTTDAYTDWGESADEDDSDDDDDFETGHHSEYDDEPSTGPTARDTTRTVTVETVPDDEAALDEANAEPKNYAPVRKASVENPTGKEERSEEHQSAEVTPEEGERGDTKATPGKGERTETTTPPSRPGLRPNRTPDYSHRYGFTQNGSTEDEPLDGTPDSALPNTPPVQDEHLRKALFGLIFTQMSAQKGIKKHGQAAWDALKKEFEQFKVMEVLEAMDASSLSTEQKAEALAALSVIKEKRDGKLKGRTVADGRPQRAKYSKEETGSPTISNDALFMNIIINAHEKRDVATADVTGAYLHAHMKDFVLLRFTGWAVDLLCEVNPEYRKYVIYEGRTKVLYVRANKAIYGCVMSGLLWYELFTSELQTLGFELNPYDYCVANATIDGSQCTIGWYVDDTHMSHRDSKVVTWLIDKLEDRFGKMSVTRGKIHDFLGMRITYNNDGTASIIMQGYIDSIIEDSGFTFTKAAPTPCSSSLFSVDTNSPRLDVPTSDAFHRTVARLIYLATRTRTDILLALGFLCGRVRAPTEQDRKKLHRLLAYLWGTKNMQLILGADSLHQLFTWVDASFAPHEDMRSHTGGVLSFGRGGLICKSGKQKINTKSSTEAELVGASDYLPNSIYAKLYMEAQGYPIDKNTFYQDNMSTMNMESNGKASAGRRSRHIHIRYFFITDHAKRGEIHITHCPTEAMLADFLTKPLQGSLFRKFRAVLLGHAHIRTLSAQPRPDQHEERVGTQNSTSSPAHANHQPDSLPPRTWANVASAPPASPVPRAPRALAPPHSSTRSHSSTSIL